MLDQALAYVGKLLSENFNIPKSRVIYEEKDAILRRFSEENLQVNFPAIAFYPSDISPVSLRPYNATKNISLSNNLASWYKFYCLKVNISLTTFCANILDQTNLTSLYFKLLLFSEFTVEGLLDSEPYSYDTSIVDLQPFTEPPSLGREGFDFEKGKYYIKEGGFSFNAFIPVKVGEFKLIRSINMGDISISDYLQK